MDLAAQVVELGEDDRRACFCLDAQLAGPLDRRRE
jgi:hypothetical protein